MRETVGVALVVICAKMWYPQIKRKKEVKSVLKTELEVVKIGKPDIATLPEGEQRAFFETLYARVLELAKENNNKD